MTGKLESEKLDEASGIQAGNDGKDKTRIFAIDETGRDLGEMKVKSTGIKDWEDITRVMGEDGPLLVIADTGDNFPGPEENQLVLRLRAFRRQLRWRPKSGSQG
jgi:hypothetical protein